MPPHSPSGINHPRLLQHFAEVADAPDAIPRLRRFILDLAVRGKLVPQDPNDEPASELLKRIAAEKERLVKEKAIKKPKALPPIEEGEIPFDIPKSWEWSQIAEIGIIDPRNDEPDTAIASFVPMPLIFAAYGKANEHEPRKWSEIKKGYTHFREGDVGLAKITPCFENGKSTVFQNLKGGFGAGTTELHIVRPIETNPSYILVFLKSSHYIETGIPKMTGTAGQKRVPKTYFSNSPFPLPPLAEQKRIVAKVDELMALCDDLEVARQARETQRNCLVAATHHQLNDPNANPREAATFALSTFHLHTRRPADIAALRQTILNLAVRGKLVEQSSAIVQKQLGEILSEPSSNGVSKGPTKDQTETEVLRISAGTSRVGYAVDEDDFKHVALTKEDVKKHRLKKGDLLACRYNGNLHYVGRFSVYLGTSERVQVNPDKLIRFRISNQEHDPWYICYAMNALTTRRAIEAQCATTVGNIGISASKLKAISIPVPPLTEQKRIVAKVDELMALCDQLEAQLTTTQTETQQLLEACLREAVA